MAERVTVDASVALSWVLPDERCPQSIALRDRAAADPSLTLLVPPTFWYELSNSLWMTIRRNRIRHDDAMALLEMLVEFGFETQVPDPGDCLALALFHNISAYDSAYLALALDTGTALWTLDRLLSRTALATDVRTEPGDLP
ncbi:MAG: type II toxin-antitoxin system VapC family toxin [Bacillota bacterium]